MLTVCLQSLHSLSGCASGVALRLWLGSWESGVVSSPRDTFGIISGFASSDMTACRALYLVFAMFRCAEGHCLEII